MLYQEATKMIFILVSIEIHAKGVIKFLCDSFQWQSTVSCYF
jgi:hypothetical protein